MQQDFQRNRRLRSALLRQGLRYSACVGHSALPLYFQVVLLCRMQDLHSMERRALLQTVANFRSQQDEQQHQWHQQQQASFINVLNPTIRFSRHFVINYSVGQQMSYACLWA